MILLWKVLTIKFNRITQDNLTSPMEGNSNNSCILLYKSICTYMSASILIEFIITHPLCRERTNKPIYLPLMLQNNTTYQINIYICTYIMEEHMLPASLLIFTKNKIRMWYGNVFLLYLWSFNQFFSLIGLFCDNIYQILNDVTRWQLANDGVNISTT